jgi:ABC-2 type transport system permease protein
MMQSEVVYSTKNTEIWQTLKAAMWLEWQTRGNWTNPWLFTLYMFSRPLSAALILVFMYRIVISSGGTPDPRLLAFLITGSGLWGVVEQVLAGIPQAVLADREEYAMLKYIYIAPQKFIVFLLGRAIPRMVLGLFSFIITVGFGLVFLGIQIDLIRVNYPLLFLTFILGLGSIALLSIAFAGLCLVFKRGAWQMPQAVAGALYLVTGAIFPIAILPNWLQIISLGMPLTYWLELIRISLMGEQMMKGFPVQNIMAMFGLFLLTGVIISCVSLLVFRISEYYAREHGQIDRTTGY